MPIHEPLRLRAPRSLVGAAPRRLRLGALLGAAALALAPTCSDSGLAPAFDYAMPERFEPPALQARDAPSPDADRYFRGPMRPETWRVELDACDSAGPIERYTWTVDGDRASTSSQCGGASVEVPAEGRYEVTLTVADAAGATASTTRTVVVQDFLVFGLGDSYGSGEGSPDAPVSAAQLDALAAARSAVSDAQQAFQDAIAEEAIAEGELDDLLPLLGDARSDYSAWQSAVDHRNASCGNIPPTPVACASAQAEASSAAAALTSSLAAVGLEHLFGTGSVLGALADLEQSARNALDAARDAFDAAQGALSAARASLEAERDAIGPRWTSRQCHRSAESGQVRAARRLEEADPRSSVTFVHLACSGATIANALVGSYGGGEPGGEEPVPAQVAAAAALTDGREIDALVVSIGGNDVGFADILLSCVTDEPCFGPATPGPSAQEVAAEICPGFPLDRICADAVAAYLSGAGRPSGSGSEIFEERIATLDDEYDALREALASEGWSTGRAPLHLTAYPTITTREARDGSSGLELCAWEPADPAAERRQNLPGVTLPEIQWADTFVAPNLEARMRASADAHGWHFVDAHVSAFEGHGYCADENWIVRIQQSIARQARPPDPVQSAKGAVHPTPEGHAAYADAILGSLRCELYPGCDPTALPRGPRDADGDGLPDERDLCVDVANPAQRDTDGDGFGNRCDADLNGDGTVDDADLALLKDAFFGSDPDADLNGDGTVDFLDLGILRSLHGEPPGPAGSL